MIIKNIKLKNFRNYKELELSFDEKVNLILGHNAQGKTNLIEAIYISSMGKSFRTPKDIELINFDSDFAYIKTVAEKEDFDTEVEISIERRSKTAVNKKIKKDKKQLTKQSQLIKNIMIVIFSPEDMKLIKEEPERRRRFLDRELCQISPAYYDALINYTKVLKQRNAYLKGEPGRNINLDILEIWDEKIAEYGSEIIFRRAEFIEKLGKISNEIQKGITNGEEEIEIKYFPNIMKMEDKENQKKIFFAAITESRGRDMEFGTTSKGPHRDDIGFFVNGIDMRNYGSQGQQRTCALSLKLAELSLIKEETGEEAILLLDDVMSELDAKRQEFLIKTLKNNQLFITTTDMDKNLLNKLENATIYSVSGGNVEKQGS